MTREEFVGITATLTTNIKALLGHMAAWIAKVDNNNANNNNRNNPTRGGEPIPVIRVFNNIPTIVTYRKSKYANEYDLEYYERRYYTKLKDDYYQFEISDSIYRCPFCYNKDYSLTNLLRHASRIADNSRKPIKDIARHSVLITYILRILTSLQEEINDARTTEVLSTSDESVVFVESVKGHSVTNEYVKVMNLTKANPEILFEEKEGAVTSGPTFVQAAGENILDATVSENFPVLAKDEKYNEAIYNTAKQIVDVVDGLPDPGDPAIKDDKRESNFRTRQRHVEVDIKEYITPQPPPTTSKPSVISVNDITKLCLPAPPPKPRD